VTDDLRRVGAVVLTYNSIDDLLDCLACLKSQRGVELKVIVVDNASRPEALGALEHDFLAAFPGCPVVDAETAPLGFAEVPAVFLRNGSNTGYSAGNNVGARLAAELGCEAVLIINPDVRIDNPDYVAVLTKLVTADPRTAVTCSALRSLSGAHENPMSEPGFFEELLWPVRMITARLWRAPAGPQPPTATSQVDKVSGACFMIRSDFLRLIGFFDTSVFLYCEESILRAQVRALGWHMMMEPGLEALHAHRSSAKGSPLARFRFWAQSRRQFHRDHGGYGPLRRALLTGSRALMKGLAGGFYILRHLLDGLSGRGVGR
jgi:GT2 family glycosyltransferase